MHAVLIALGSAGDVHPFVGIGRRLVRRGHRVTVFANERYREAVEGAGLGFAAAGDRETFEAVAADPDAFHPRRGPRLVFRVTAEHLGELVDALRERLAAGGGDAVMVGSSLALAARLVQEADGVPLATVHLQPAVLRSVVDPPELGPYAPMPARAPRWVKRLLWWAADRLVLDPIVGPPLERERRRLELPPVSRPLDGWWHSPERVIGLFPDWYAPPPPDWPPQLALTGFPLYDEGERRPPDPELDEWLAAGPPPVVFTAGSANLHAAPFFAASVEACRRLGRRALLLTAARENLPAELSESVLHRAYAPFGRVLPRAAALVSHGGVGTVAQGLAAAVPQGVAAFAHDQFDNGARLERLGAGTLLPARRYDAARAAAALERLLGSPAVAERCRELARRIAATDPLEETCDLIEELVARRVSSAGRARGPASRGRPGPRP